MVKYEEKNYLLNMSKMTNENENLFYKIRWQVKCTDEVLKRRRCI